MRRRVFLTSAPILILISACSSIPAPESSEDLGTPSEAPTATASDGGASSRATVDVTITGASEDGHYQFELTSGGCIRNPEGQGTFGVTSTDVDSQNPLMVHITIFDAAAAAGGTDSQFSASFVFPQSDLAVDIAPFLDAQFPDQDNGAGTATLHDRGSTATVTIVGTSSISATPVEATIECHQVAGS